MTRDLVISVSESINTIVLSEDKKIVELHKEKKNKKFSVGDIYLAQVKKIMGSLNAAFLEIGYNRDAFLHYLDLGPQFQTLNNYTKKAINNPKNIIPPHKFTPLPDINKYGKIGEVLKTGQKILVQISKEPISTKGPRLTSEISIAGRNIVLLPFSNKVSISQKIRSKEERDRLRQLMDSIKPKNYGIIVRTVARKRRVAVLDAELRKLVKTWEDAIGKLHQAKTPELVIDELNQTSAFLRDVLNKSFNSITVDNRELYYEIKDYISSIAPGAQKILRLYTGKNKIFQHFGIDKQIQLLFGKTVSIKKGAYLIIEHTEALHVVDVNSGNRSNNAENQETNAFEVNVAAAEEIARQLRLRDMGGIVVVDFIDMRKINNKKQVYFAMKNEMKKDRTKHSILPLSKFGLMQITRQRVRPEMNIQTIEPCPVCEGTGEITPSFLLVDEIKTTLKYLVKEKNPKTIVLKVHPFIYAYLKKGFFPIAYKWKFKLKFNLKIRKDDSYNFLEYYFFDKNKKRIRF